jgi:predicted GNAT family acetyltransferase
MGAAYGSALALLTEGFVAGAVIAGALVARAHTSCQSRRYADISVATAEAWRGQGLATAAASLVCRCVQSSGRAPTWNTSAENLASQRIAQKLGFLPYSRVSYLTLA